jgi:hypothetical protein
MAGRKDHQYYFSRFILLNYNREVDGGGWCEVSKPCVVSRPIFTMILVANNAKRQDRPMIAKILHSLILMVNTPYQSNIF